MNTMPITLADLQRSEASLLKRIDELNKLRDDNIGQRHEENQRARAEDRALILEIRETVKDCLTEQRRTNGRVTTLEAQVRELFARIKDGVKRAADGLHLPQVVRWIAIIGGTYFFLTQVLRFHQ